VLVLLGRDRSARLPALLRSNWRIPEATVRTLLARPAGHGDEESSILLP